MQCLILHESPESLGFYRFACLKLTLIGELSRVSACGWVDRLGLDKGGEPLGRDS